jgi:hypothetical protein
LQFVNDAIHERLERRRYLRGEFGAPFRGCRLHAQHQHFTRRIAQQLERNHQVGEPKLMHGRLARQPFQRLAFEPKERPRGLSGVNRIDDKQTPDTGDVREERETLCPAVEENDAGRHTRVSLEPVDGMYTDSIIRMNEISEPKHNRFGHYWILSPLEAAIALRSSSSSSFTGTFL